MSVETFEVILSPEAERAYTRQDRLTRQRIAAAIDRLKVNPASSPNVTRLHGELRGNYRIRLGTWRIIYSVDMKTRKILVKLIRSRGDIYKR